MDTLNAILEDITHLLILLVIWLGVKTTKAVVAILEWGFLWTTDATS